MPKRTKKTKFGELPPQYNFPLNPYPHMRFSACPRCRSKTGQRKLPLLIHIDPLVMIALNYTNRYCRRCDLLIARKAEIEHFLAEMFCKDKPEIVGNDYLIFGTIEKKAWRENMLHPKPVHELCAHISDFKSYEELRMTRSGWFPEGRTPPMMEPPSSAEWLKRETS